MQSYTLYSTCLDIPGQDNGANKLPDTVVVEGVSPGLLVQFVHQVQQRVRADDLVTDVCTQQGVRLVAGDGRHKPRHHCQSARRDCFIYAVYKISSVCGLCIMYFCMGFIFYLLVLGNVHRQGRVEVISTDLLHLNHCQHPVDTKRSLFYLGLDCSQNDMLYTIQYTFLRRCIIYYSISWIQYLPAFS